jgi:transcriptional regulator with PAS, ATPase and Fis domain
LIEVADGGSLFLDEIGDMELGVQAQFLKVIEEKNFRRLGEVKPRRSDFRLICATHKDLTKEVSQEQFRKELFFRIQVFPILLPPLRERLEDIPHLVTFLLRTLGAVFTKISPEVLGLLMTYTWPGNIRELRNILERALVLSRGAPFSPAHFPGISQATLPAELDLFSRNPKKEEGTRIQSLLNEFGGDKIKVAKALGISKATLYRKLKKNKKSN